MSQQITPSRPPVEIALTAPASLQQLALALPRHLTAERFARVALTEVRRNPELASCDPASFMSALVQSAQLGLEIGNGLGHAYMIAFRNSKTGKKDVQLIVGYRGFIDLVRRSGLVRRLSAHVVYVGDTFDYAFGTSEYIRHVPCGEVAAAKITHGYAIAEFKDGSLQMEVMTRKEIDAIRDRGRRNPVWDSDYSEMARKTLVRRIAKFLPLSPEMSTALTLDVEAEEILGTKPSADARKIMNVQIAAAEEENEKRAAAEAEADAKFEEIMAEAEEP